MSCNGNCSSCGGCGGSCSGCARELVITPKELAFLEELGQVAFLPVARTLGDLTPVYLEEGEENREQYSLILQCLEKKGLISLDYDKPLKGIRQDVYKAYPVHGSIALTERGQKVLELIDLQGISQEN